MAFGDYPEQPKNIPWKLILIIGGGVLIAGSIFVWVYFATRAVPASQTSSVSTGKLFGQSSTQTDGQTDGCAGATDSDACKIGLIKKQAVSEKKSDSCDSLKDRNKDDCYWAVAIATTDSGLCAKILQTDLQAQCSDEMNAAAAIAKPDSVMCDKITDVQIKMACQAIIRVFPKGNVCDNSTPDCFFAHVLSVANQMNDSGVCKVLDPKKQALCVAGVAVDDPDHDGLDSTVERVLYGTDPYNADTDGDGYPDGAEVKSGHDPLKK